MSQISVNILKFFFYVNFGTEDFVVRVTLLSDNLSNLWSDKECLCFSFTQFVFAGQHLKECFFTFISYCKIGMSMQNFMVLLVL